jgi:hypothetical protein
MTNIIKGKKLKYTPISLSDRDIKFIQLREIMKRLIINAYCPDIRKKRG